MTTPEEDLLRSVIMGEISPTDERVLAAAARSPELAASLEELAEVTGLLDQDAAHERGALDSADSDEDAPGRARLNETLDGLYRADPPAPHALLSLPRVMAVAALLLALVGLIVTKPWHDEPRRDIPMGSSIVLESPVGEVAEYRFQWSGEFGPGNLFRVRVWDAGDAIGAPPRVVSRLSSATTWTPEDQLPRRIRWTVAVYPASGGDVMESESDSSEAWLAD